jgi:hypothetical protein
LPRPDWLTDASTACPSSSKPTNSRKIRLKRAKRVPSVCQETRPEEQRTRCEQKTGSPAEDRVPSNERKEQAMNSKAILRKRPVVECQRMSASCQQRADSSAPSAAQKGRRRQNHCEASGNGILFNHSIYADYNADLREEQGGGIGRPGCGQGQSVRVDGCRARITPSRGHKREEKLLSGSPKQGGASRHTERPGVPTRHRPQKTAYPSAYYAV